MNQTTKEETNVEKNQFINEAFENEDKRGDFTSMKTKKESYLKVKDEDKLKAPLRYV